jgi:predicted permease
MWSSGATAAVIRVGGALREALRRAYRRPRLLVGTMLLLAPCMGLFASVFSVIDGVMFRPLPFDRAHELVLLQEQSIKSGTSYATLSYPEVVALRAFPGFAAVSAFSAASDARTVLLPTDSFRAKAAAVDVNFLPLLRVTPLRGRAFAASDLLRADTVIIISSGLWTRVFGGAESAVGSMLRLDRGSAEVIGILPPGFIYPHFGRGGQPDMLVPLVMNAGDETSVRAKVMGIARIAPDRDERSVQKDVDRVRADLRKTLPAVPSETRVRVVNLLDGLFELYRPMLWVFLGGAAIVLLAAASSLGLTLLSSAVGRELEFQVRSMLGASRFLLIAQMTSEAFVICLSATIVGIWCASATFTSIVGVLPARTFQTMAAGVNWRAFAVAMLANLGVCTVASVAPALWRWRINDGNGDWTVAASAPRHARRLVGLLLVAQLAVATALTATAVTLVRFFAARQPTALGIDATGTLVIDRARTVVDLRSPEQRYTAFITDIEGISRQPAIIACGAATAVPLQNSVPELAAEDDSGRDIGPVYRVTAGYFSAIGVRLLSGRDFTMQEVDDEGEAGVAIVNGALASRYWPRGRAVGQRLRLKSGRTLEVVGVVNSFAFSFEEGPAPAIFLPPNPASFRGMSLVARTHRQDVILAARELQTRLAGDRGFVTQVYPYERIREAALVYPRFHAVLFAVLGLLAAIIALTGTYGVAAQAVSLRVREFAIRLAIGSSRAELLTRLVIDHGIIVVIGVACGLGLSVLGHTTLNSALEGLGDQGPVAFVVTGLVLLTAGVATIVTAALRVREAKLIALLRS